MVIEVDPEQLTSVNDDIDKAVERIPGWRDRLDEINDRLSGQNCSDGFTVLNHVFGQELQMIGERLEAFKGTLTGCAEAFRMMDDDIAQALTPVDPAPMPTPGGQDVAVP